MSVTTALFIIAALFAVLVVWLIIIPLIRDERDRRTAAAKTDEQQADEWVVAVKTGPFTEVTETDTSFLAGPFDPETVADMAARQDAARPPLPRRHATRPTDMPHHTRRET